MVCNVIQRSGATFFFRHEIVGVYPSGPAAIPPIPPKYMINYLYAMRARDIPCGRPHLIVFPFSIELYSTVEITTAAKKTTYISYLSRL
jgi:hypothetical protein